ANRRRSWPVTAREQPAETLTMIRQSWITAIACAAVGFSTPAARAQTILQANPGPSNNGGSSGWAIFFDLNALSGPVTVTEMTTASTAAASAAFTVEVFTRVGSGPG